MHTPIYYIIAKFVNSHSIIDKKMLNLKISGSDRIMCYKTLFQINYFFFVEYCAMNQFENILVFT